MSKIIIQHSPTADTRTCDVSTVTKEELARSTTLHISDVAHGIKLLQDMLTDRAISHDTTKISDFDQFFHDFKTGFKDTIWWEMHKKEERHHLLFPGHDKPGEGVNLIDILEWIVDGTMAGMARSGEYYYSPIRPEILELAVQNTVQLLLSNIEVQSE